MTTTDALGTLAGQSAAGPAAKPRDQLGQRDFLELMIAQLRNQDPFKPMDSNQFLGQLAQFGTVSGIQNMESALVELAGSLRSSQVLGGSSLVGREVLAPADTATLTAGGSVRGAVDVPEGATSVQISVRDASGQLVRTFSIPASAGLAEFTWDGLTATGSAAPAGEYAFSVVATDGHENVSLQALLSSRVTSVTIDPARNDLILNTGIGPVALRDVRRVM